MAVVKPLVLVLAGVLGSIGAAAPGAGQAAEPEQTAAIKRAEERKRKANRRVCRRIVLTGSRITRRICRKQSEWDEIERSSQELMQRMGALDAGPASPAPGPQ